MRFDLKTVVLEGPDAAGKTTAFREIHRRTGFKWNIHDRSTLSMLCYAIMYNRDVNHWRHLVSEEYHDTNNAIVVFLPDLAVIQDRISTRGDEFQDIKSVIKLHEIFSTEVSKFEKYPNVLIVRQEIPDYDVISKWLLKYEKQDYTRLAQTFELMVQQTPRKEVNFLKASWSDNDFSSVSKAALFYESEAAYYETTRLKILDKLRDELDGRNEYSTPQTLTSRRFIMTQDSCISYIHYVYRDQVFYINAVCRSSEMSKIFHHDIHFLAEMGRFAKKTLSIPHDANVRFSLTLDSAHVI